MKFLLTDLVLVVILIETNCGVKLYPEDVGVTVYAPAGTLVITYRPRVPMVMFEPLGTPPKFTTVPTGMPEIVPLRLATQVAEKS